ncbi:hypothetical protein BDV23DRAFT_180423 [Aspergillus alliaceus]|uniref:WSC domain-containing protein n=1 Tax=Petromyces alliaceus TaxID=209559 RepID=A0A5N7CIE8_PETAA|nr:hypothetical protein BDV23DRAFT_180423 [Aspergillus alliaceus]
MKLLSISSAYLAVLMALLVSAQTPNIQQACYSDSGSFKIQSKFEYQSPGYCTRECTKQGAKYMALHDHSECWCGNSEPDKKYLESDDKCNARCSGWPEAYCGAEDAWSVQQISATEEEVTESDSTSTSSASGSATGSSSSLLTPTPWSNGTASATKSATASRSASSASATPTTSTSAATRRFKLPFFL